MSLPAEVRVGLTVNGLAFDLRVSAFAEGSRTLFPEQEAADAIRQAPGLPAAAVRASACALDAAVERFLPAFEQALCSVLKQGLEQ